MIDFLKLITHLYGQDEQVVHRWARSQYAEDDATAQPHTGQESQVIQAAPLALSIRLTKQLITIFP
jgi:hypothetical protein